MPLLEKAILVAFILAMGVMALSVAIVDTYQLYAARRRKRKADIHG